MRGLTWRITHSPGYAPLDSSFKRKMRYALADLIEGARSWRSWIFLATEAVKSQYRRTILGPWWITLQAAFFIIGLSLLFGLILGEPIDLFLPYVAVGWIVFSFLAGCLRSATLVFTSAADVITSTRQPLSRLAFRATMVEFIQFTHNAFVLVPLVALGWIPIEPHLLLVLPAVGLLLVNGFASMLWLGSAVVRFRDLTPIVQTALQILMIFTPVFWTTSSVDTGERAILLVWNPFAYLVELVREPLLGTSAPVVVIAGSLVITGVGLILAVVLFAGFRSRLPYWVQ